MSLVVPGSRGIILASNGRLRSRQVIATQLLVRVGPRKMECPDAPRVVDQLRQAGNALRDLATQGPRARCGRERSPITTARRGRRPLFVSRRETTSPSVRE